MPMRLTLSLAAAALAALAVPSAAQERSFNFSLRGGVAAVPSYPGSDDYEAAPDIGFGFGALQWGGRSYGTAIGSTPANGVSLRGAFRFIGERDDKDHPELAGLEDIDPAVELGFGLTYRQTNWLAFGEVRQGFGGHDGVTGTIGADLIFRPSDRFTVTAGPRINFGNSEYAGTYFGVTAAEAAASSFGAYDADGGVLGAGVEVRGIYELDDRWAVEGQLSYEKLQNSAADSPITRAGSDDQWRVSIGLRRSFTLNF